MAWSDYDIDPDAARPIVQRARGRFDDLNGMENTLETTGEAVADAADEDKINTALKNAQTNFLHPFTVTMIRTAESIFDGTDNVINIYDNADTDMSEAARDKAVEDMKWENGQYDNVPDYTSSDSTAADGQGAAPNTEGYDW